MFDDSDYLPESPKESDKPRKRKLDPKNWKKTKEKVRKRKLKDSGFKIVCNHQSNESFCKADSLSEDAIREFHDKYWSLGDSVKERMFIQRNITISNVSRRRSTDALAEPMRKRDWSTRYKVPTELGFVDVCKESFMGILSAKRRTVEKAAHDIMKKDEDMKETRGGARQPNEEKLILQEEIIGHIKSFKCREKHYGRANAPGRSYLANHLCVKKMWELFCDGNETKCKYSTYYRLFTTRFNLGFGSSKTDVCSECVKLKTELKSNDKTEKEKDALALDLRLHKARAKRFYQELKKFSEDTLTINFDLMQNQPLPKTPIGEAFYARQIWYYIFAVVIHGETGVLNRDTVHFYRWLETDYGRGSNEIISCLNHFLNHVVVPMLSSGTIKKLRLFCDACVGQNKNYAMIVMLHKFCISNNIEYDWIFPVRGHSYMPADRAFGLVEKKLRKKDTILLPEDYDSIVSSIGTLHNVGRTVMVQNWKEASNDIIRPKKDFKITEAKVIGLELGEKTKVGFKPVYSVNYSLFKLLKNNFKFETATLRLLQQKKANRVSEAKARDVKALLTSMGHDWEQLEFYGRAFANPTEQDDEEAITVVNEDTV